MSNIPVCSLCGSEESSVVRRKLFDIPGESGPEFFEHVVHQCHSCGFHYVHPLPSADELQRIIERNTGIYIQESVDARRASSKRIIDLLGRFRSEPGSLLDIGCATGLLMETAREAGWRVSGIDAFEEAVLQAREEKGLEVYHASLGLNGKIQWPHGIAGRTFDAVSMMWVINLISPPGLLLQRVRDILNPSGLLIIGTTNIRSLPSRLWGNRWRGLVGLCQFHYSDQSIRTALTQNGFECLSINRTPIRYNSLGYILKKISGYDLLHLKKNPPLSWLIPIPTIDCMEVVARKA